MEKHFTTSVLMSLFWKENPAYLDTALESLHKQTLQADEIILVIEGILPDSLQYVVNKWLNIFTSNVLKLITSGNAQGLPACLNVGLEQSIGDIIIRFDTDDWCYKNRIEDQINFFKENPNVSLISACMEEYDDDLEELIAIRKVPSSHQEIYNYAKWRNPFNHPSVAYKKHVAQKLGGYPLVGANEDYAFFCNFLVNNFQTFNLTKSIVKARTGKHLANRRSGKRYRDGEVECLQYLHKIGFYSTSNFYFHLISKKIIRSLPLFLVRGIYKRILR